MPSCEVSLIVRLLPKLECIDQFVFNSHNKELLFPKTGSGQGYITTNNQSVSMSWYRAHSRTIDQSLLSP
jgi:hypothetical protein